MTEVDLAVISGASLDLIHVGAERHATAGGAGLYTALAAAWAGARVRMIAPRPEPMPVELAGAATRFEWSGPHVSPEALPRFEIVQRPDGLMVMPHANWGAEAALSPADLPPGGAGATIVYTGPLADARVQLDFVRHTRAAGARVAFGTYPRASEEQPEVVREAADLADYFFCNEVEAARLFGAVEAVRARPGQVIFLTMGGRGVRVLQGADASHIAAHMVRRVDPTGAGDTFCGVTLAGIARGESPLLAARRGVACAARVVGEIGPAALLREQPLPPLGDPSVARVDGARVEAVAALVAGLPEVRPFPFVGAEFPPPGDPAALDFFFASVLQQFGFWHHDGRRYREPMIAPLGGTPRKGSDFLWAAYRRWHAVAPEALAPEGQAGLSAEAFARALRADDGASPLPTHEENLTLARRYGREMVALGWTPATILRRANRSARPLASLLQQLDRVGGYKEDPLRKKATLLGIILQQRPERFLRVEPGESVPPIIDYHLQRATLRTGLVEVVDGELRARLRERRLLDATEEWPLRYAAYQAVARLQAASGRSMGAVDWFFFGARRFCPEMHEPDCPSCPIQPACARRTALFQPVIRTTFY